MLKALHMMNAETSLSIVSPGMSSDTPRMGELYLRSVVQSSWLSNPQ